MKKLIPFLICLISLSAFGADFPIYVSTKKDEEVVAKLFETTRRINISNQLGMWKQDMLKNITLECAVTTKVINTKKNMIMPNETYSPVLRKEDMDFLNYMNIKVGTYRSLDKKYCEIIASKSAEELFNQCYIANIPSGDTILQNTGYPRDYLVVNSQFRDGEKIDVGVYCNAISGDPQTKQFFATKGLATWLNPPKYQKVQFSNWSENLMLGSVKVLVDGIKEPYIFTTIFK